MYAVKVVELLLESTLASEVTEYRVHCPFKMLHLVNFCTKTHTYRQLCNC
jgi:hypothetical protein